MPDTLAGVFLDTAPVLIRLAPAARAALGVADADIQLKSATIRDGWLLAIYQDPGNGDVTKYLLPPDQVLYLRQLQPAIPPSPAPGQG